MKFVPKVEVGFISMLVLLAGSCRQDMHDQARVDAYEESPLTAGVSSGFLPPAGTIARGQLRLDKHLYAGSQAGHLATKFPHRVTLAMMQRGRNRYEIYCQPCHGASGRGDGPVAQRGFFAKIGNLQEPRLREVPIGHIFGVISNGFNNMPSYDHAIVAGDRWAIVAYLRALQYSQNAPREDVPPELLLQLQGKG